MIKLWLASAVPISMLSLLCIAPQAQAQAQNFDVRSFFDQPTMSNDPAAGQSYLSTLGVAPQVVSPFKNTSYPSSLTGQSTNNGSGSDTGGIESGGAQGDMTHQSYQTGTGPSAMPPQTSNYTGTQSQPLQLQQATYGLLAPNSLAGQGNIPSGQYSFGFSGGAAGIYRGVSGILTGAGSLPATSTSSVDFDITQ